MENIRTRKVGRVLIIAVAMLLLLFLIAFLGLMKNINTSEMEYAAIPGFSLYYQDLQPDTIADISNAVEFIREEYAEVYGIPARTQTEIVVYSDPAQFKRAYLGLILAWVYRDTDWIVGGAYQDMLAVMSPEVDDGMHSYEDKLDILQHELIHVYNYHLNEMPDVFLDEGLAVYLSGQGGDEGKPDGPIPTFNEMQSWNFEEFGDKGGYYYSYRFCQYMESKVGLSGLLSLLETEDFEGITGMSYEDNYNEWMAYNIE
jgi:hypothetical protein